MSNYDERPDFLREQDEWQAKILENKAIERAERHEKLLRAEEYGSSGSAEDLSVIVLRMIEQERYSCLMYKDSLRWDVDSVWEAVQDACIQLGLSTEDFSPWFLDQGHEIEIGLI